MSNAFVHKLQGFVDLNDGEVAALSAVTNWPRKVGAKQDLIREGDKPGPIFVMIEGWGCRYKILPNGLRQITAFLMPGDACDLHLSMLNAMDHSIQTLTQARVAMVSRAEMDRLMDGNRGISKAMYVSQLIDEATLRAWIVSMGRRTSIERVAHLMCELYARARWIGLAQEAEFILPASQVVLADALGMTAVHINRVLKELRIKGAMALRRGSLHILDPQKLAIIAGFDENYLHRRTARMARV
jgi:CRP-like cAMP-binding protein